MHLICNIHESGQKENLPQVFSEQKYLGNLGKPAHTVRQASGLAYAVSTGRLGRGRPRDSKMHIGRVMRLLFTLVQFSSDLKLERSSGSCGREKQVSVGH